MAAAAVVSKLFRVFLFFTFWALWAWGNLGFRVYVGKLICNWTLGLVLNFNLFGFFILYLFI